MIIGELLRLDFLYSLSSIPPQVIT